jgi:hypothetical protein
MGSQHQIDHGIASRGVALEACGRQPGLLKSQTTGMTPRAPVPGASPGSLAVTLCYRQESQTHQAARISYGFARRDKILIGKFSKHIKCSCCQTAIACSRRRSDAEGYRPAVVRHRIACRGPSTAEKKPADCPSARAVFASSQEETFRRESENVTDNRHRVQRLETEIHRIVLQ